MKRITHLNGALASWLEHASKYVQEDIATVSYVHTVCIHSAAVCNQFFLVFPGSPITVERQTEPAKEDRTLDDMPGVEQ